MNNCSEKNLLSLRGASPVSAQSCPPPHQLQEASVAAIYLTELIKQVPEHQDRLSQSPAQVSRGHLVHLAKAAHPTDTVGTLDAHHRKQRGQTSTDHIITWGTREVPRAPCTHPTWNSSHFFSLNAKNALRMQTSPKRHRLHTKNQTQ